MEIDTERFDIDHEIGYNKRQLREIAESHGIIIPNTLIKRRDFVTLIQDFLKNKKEDGVDNGNYKVGDLLVCCYRHTGCSYWTKFFIIEKITATKKYRICEIDYDIIEESEDCIGRSTVIVPKKDKSGKYFKSDSEKYLISSDLRRGKNFYELYDSNKTYSNYFDYGD